MKLTKTLINRLFQKKEPTCYAPISSLRFDHSGKILACSFNRGNVLGEFPEQSIEEVWFGKNLKQLQTALNKKDFSLGCQSCEKSILSGNREAAGIAQYDNLKNLIAHKNFPTMFDFELGSTCNFECIMCSGEYSTSIRKNREKKSAYYSPYEDHPDLFVEQLTPFLPHLKEVRFLGGEPFLMKIYYNIWDKILEINPDLTISILTNGSILNKRVRNILEKGNFKISVSIDSIVKKTYEKIRKNSDFDQVMNNVQYFREFMKENNHTMNFNLCVMRQNWSEIPEYFEYCNQHEIKVICHTVQFPPHCSLWNLSSSELEEIENFYDRAEIKGKSITSNDNLEAFNGIHKQIKNWKHAAITRENKEVLTNQQQEQILYEQIQNENLSNHVNSLEDTWKLLTTTLNDFSEDEKAIIYVFLNDLPIHTLVSELNISSHERLFERFKIIIKKE